MIGAIAGDIIGSRYERESIDTKDFPLFSEDSRFTDDSILTVAAAETLLYGTNYQDNYRRYAIMYKNRGFGSGFKGWVKSSNPAPYNSYGNGSMMRVSPVAWSFGIPQGGGIIMSGRNNLDKVLEEAKRSAECTHNHPEGIKGAQAIAQAIYLARSNFRSKASIIESLERDFGYDLSRNVCDFDRSFDVSCQGTVPRCMAAFREAESFEDGIRTAVAMGGDADTNASIVGAILEAFLPDLPVEIVKEVMDRLPFQMQYIIGEFYKKYRQ